MTNIYNCTTPNWEPLIRALKLAGKPEAVIGDFMWMCEEPENHHQYKHCDTRNYAFLTANTPVDGCKAEIANALSLERTLGKLLDARLNGGAR